MTNVADRLNHAFVNIIFSNVANEMTVDFEIVHGQVLEVGKRG